MIIRNFINDRAGQLAYYVRAFWDFRIPYSELELYFWDVLEEWLNIDSNPSSPYSNKERVFWFVLHQTQDCKASELLSNPEIRAELEVCLASLEGNCPVPLDYVGIRP
ncbi:hypothetical protein H8B19_10225 [Neptunicella marina]|uniref:Uncharacterized protein n=1 Tax=Neptunicella marina TaxID=2125989 RepID=A0A8J6IVJ4_9ALTE|nr:hypothetical protein [Neptunicella marina]